MKWDRRRPGVVVRGDFRVKVYEVEKVYCEGNEDG